MRRFNLYKRGNVFYVRFWDPETHSYTTAISTRERDEQAAYAAVYHFEKHGIMGQPERTIDHVLSTHRLKTQIASADLSPTDVEEIVAGLRERNLLVAAITPSDKESIPMADYLNKPFDVFLEWFWDYDNSPYVERKRRHGHSIGRSHCEERLRHVRNHWRPWIKETSTTLASMSYASLDQFSAHLGTKRLTGQTKNHILTVATSALRYAYEMRVIPENPARGLIFFSTRHKKRSILTPEEAKELFRLSWHNETAKLASFAAATTGLRAGELAALRLEDIEDDRIIVRGSFSRREGLKGTKTGEERDVPIISELRDRLRAHGGSNPHGETFVFWTTDAGRPLSPRRFYDGLRDALAMLSGMTSEKVQAAHRAAWRRRDKKKPEPGDDEAAALFRKTMDAWQTRGVSFHSWRHFFAANMADVVDRRAMIATGHRTAAVFDTYADHAAAAKFREVGDAAEVVFCDLFLV